MKVFGGVAVRRNGQAVSASYALQLSDTGNGFGSGFRKHLGDIRYKATLLPAPHMPVDFDLHFNTGWIENLGNVPITDRFFGGNVEQNFLEGSDWQLRSNPFIRSFPQNGMTSNSRFGGDRFLSLNLTVAPTVWKRPLVPEELAESRELLDGQLSTAGVTLALDYEAHDPAIRQALGMTESLEELASAMRTIEEVFTSVDDEESGDLEELLFECQLSAISASEQVAVRNAGKAHP